MDKYFVIKGGGPAGLSSAIHLLKNGFKCKIIERAGYPENMRNRGFQVLENYTSKEDSLNLFKDLGVEDFFCFPLNKAVFFNFDYNFYNLFSKENFGYLIKRGAQEGSIDLSLLRKARELGVEIIFKDEKIDICATGPIQPDGIAQERHFKTDDKTRIWVLMEPKKVYGGYSYLFTHNGLGTFGCALTYNFKKIKEISKKSWEFFQDIENFPVEDLKIFHSFINFYIPEKYEDKGILYAGEASGMQDFFLGMGIRIAIESGILAGDSLIYKKSYSEEIKKRFLKNFKRDLILRILYEKIPYFLLKNILIKGYKKDSRELLYKIKNFNGLNFLFPFFSYLCKNRGICLHKLKPHFCRAIKKI